MIESLPTRLWEAPHSRCEVVSLDPGDRGSSTEYAFGKDPLPLRGPASLSLAPGILEGAIERQEDDHKAGFPAKPFVVVAAFSAEARQGHRGCLTGILARACESGSALGPLREPASLPLPPGVLGGAIGRQLNDQKTRTGDRCKANRARVRQIAASG